MLLHLNIFYIYCFVRIPLDLRGIVYNTLEHFYLTLFVLNNTTILPGKAPRIDVD